MTQIHSLLSSEEVILPLYVFEVLFQFDDVQVCSVQVYQLCVVYTN